MSECICPKIFHKFIKEDKRELIFYKNLNEIPMDTIKYISRNYGEYKNLKTIYAPIANKEDYCPIHKKRDTAYLFDYILDFKRQCNFPRYSKEFLFDFYTTIFVPEQWKYLYVKPGKYNDMIYIDIKRAFFSIYKNINFDLAYDPTCEMYIPGSTKLPQEFLDFVENKRSFRNNLIGLCARFEENGKFTSFINPSFSHFILDRLQCVMKDIHDNCEPAYINTDGAIIPRKNFEKAKEIIKSWNLDWSIKGEGKADIRAVGIYKVGSTISGSFKDLTPKCPYDSNVFQIRPTVYDFHKKIF